MTLGALCVLGITRLLSSLLYAVQPTDPSSFVVALTGIAVTAIAACAAPAMTASLVDPAIALRCE